MQQLIPSGGPTFYGNSPENLRFRELQRSFASILQGIPPIDSYSISEFEGDLDSIAQARLDVLEIGEFQAKYWVEDKIDEPTREIAEYRFRFRDARRELVRSHLQDLMAEINRLVITLFQNVPNDKEPVTHEDWPKFVAAFQQVERLAGSQIPQQGRWPDMRRHIAWGQGQDVHDIALMDWPSVRADIEASLYSELAAGSRGCHGSGVSRGGKADRSGNDQAQVGRHLSRRVRAPAVQPHWRCPRVRKPPVANADQRI